MGTSHHWNLRDERGTVGSRPCPGPTSPVPLPTPHHPSPDGHEVEDVGHPWAVAQEAADADLEHDGNHQNPVPVGRRGSGWGRDRKPPQDGDQEEHREADVPAAGRRPRPVAL